MKRNKTNLLSSCMHSVHEYTLACIYPVGDFHTFMSQFVCVYIYTYIHICVYMYIYACICLCMNMHICMTYKRTYSSTYACITYIHTYTHTYMYNIHTHLFKVLRDVYTHTHDNDLTCSFWQLLISIKLSKSVLGMVSLPVPG